MDNDTKEIDVGKLTQDMESTRTPQRFEELAKKSYSSSSKPEEKLAAAAWLGVIIAITGLIGVYVSRYPEGWPAQIATGLLVWIFGFGAVILALYGIEKWRDSEKRGSTE